MSLPKPPFEQVVAEHGARVLRVCRAVVGPVDADDAWSETFLAALRAYPELPADADLAAWLVTIAHRKAIDEYRRAVRRAVPVAELPEHASGFDLPGVDGLDGLGGPGGPGGTGGPAGTGGPGQLDGAALWQAVKQLPNRQRQCIAYHYLGGLTFPQIAELLGGSADAARRAAHDGIRSLRVRLNQPLSEEER